MRSFTAPVAVLLVLALPGTMLPAMSAEEPDQQATATEAADSGVVDAGIDHSIALRSDGTVWTWGSNASGQLGDGTKTSRPTVAEVPDLDETTHVAAGGHHSLAVRVDGSLWAWGANSSGQLGDSTTSDQQVPTEVEGLENIVEAAGGNAHSLAVDGDGAVWAWGLNSAGQLGDGSATSRSEPIQVPGLDGVVAVTAGGLPGWAGHSLALKSDGTVWAWGYNKVGQLGDGTKNHRFSPVQIEGLADVVAIAAGGDSSYALAADGSVWAWGENGSKQLGNPDAKKSSPVPVKVSIDDVVGIAAADTHALAITSGGSVWGWGNNNTGQLGHGSCGPGTPKTVADPVQVADLEDATAIGGGHVHSLAALDDGSAWAWGNNGRGQLGDGTTDVSCVPVQVDGLDEVGPYVPDSLDQHLPDSVEVDDAEPGIVRYEGGPGQPGLVVEVESAGGISSNQISVRPNRQATLGISEVAVSPAYDITVPKPENVEAATLTLPYDPARLDDSFREDELAIATYLEDEQMWVPVASPTVVDEDAKTVTTDVEHFSLYAVVGGVRDDFWTPAAIERLFGRTSVRCVPEGDASGIDVAFMIDTSGSMSWNDPSHLRVEGAELFVDEMRDDDQAGVISFSSSAVARIGLTVLGEDGRAAVSSALDETRFASGGTNIFSAVHSGIDILKANDGGGRLRVGILMTDGQDSSDPASLVDEAVEGAIAVYAIGLGDVDENKLRAVAEGTGGTYQHLESADQLPALYGELVRDIIDDGTDSDGDGLTDCEERNGLFSPAMVWLPSLGTNHPLDDWGVFSFTEPENPDTDSDETDDGDEVERVRFDDNPDVARAFQVLVDGGRETYFLLVTGRPDRFDTDDDEMKDPVFPQLTENCDDEDFGTSPFAWDSDEDGLSDGLECQNGTDPLSPDRGTYGIRDLAPFTLFAPDRYIGPRQPLVPYLFETRASTIHRVALNRDPVYYDEDYNCVSNCSALIEWAAERDNSNGWGICVAGFGNCVDDEAQIRDRIRDVVELQGVFDDDATIRDRHVGITAAFICGSAFSDSGTCAVDDFIATAGTVATGLLPDQLDRGATQTLKETIGDRTKRPNPGRVGLVASALVVIGATVYRHAQKTEEQREEEIRRSVEECYKTDVLQVLDYIGTQHPCEGRPMFLPGEADAGAAARNTSQAIVGDPDAGIPGDPTKHVLSYATEAERDQPVRDALAADGRNPVNPRQWYHQYEACAEGSYDGALFHCDEYPYYSSNRGGPSIMSAANPSGSRIEVVPEAENRAEGGAYGTFATKCSRRVKQEREPFLVVPLVGEAEAPTTFVCPP